MNTFDRIKKQLEIQAQTQDEVEEFDIEYIKINEFTPELAALFKPYSKIKSLGFSGCSLTSLNNFPKIDILQNLILEENQLDSSALKFIVENYKKLVCLSLSQNKIKQFEEIRILRSLPNLHQLDLSENPISELPDYHQQIFKILPELKVLDNKNEKGENIIYSDEEDEEEGPVVIKSPEKFNIDESESSSGSELVDIGEGKLKYFDDMDEEERLANDQHYDDSNEDDCDDNQDDDYEDDDFEDQQPFKKRKNG